MLHKTSMKYKPNLSPSKVLQKGMNFVLRCKISTTDWFNRFCLVYNVRSWKDQFNKSQFTTCNKGILWTIVTLSTHNHYFYKRVQRFRVHCLFSSQYYTLHLYICCSSNNFHFWHQESFNKGLCLVGAISWPDKAAGWISFLLVGLRYYSSHNL